MDFLGNLNGRASRFFALKTIAFLWGTVSQADRFLDDIDESGAFFKLAAARDNLRILDVSHNLDLIKRLNLPVILEFMPPGALSPRYLALIENSGDRMVLKGGEKEKTISVPAAKMRSYWTGEAYIPWRNFFNCNGDVPISAPKESVFTLKMLLLDIGFKDIKPDYDYDDATKETIIQIQEKHGIKVDGIVGAQTKIVIYNAKKGLKIPHIIFPDHSPADKNRGIEEH